MRESIRKLYRRLRPKEPDLQAVLNEQPCFGMTRDLANDVEKIMPGEIMTVAVRGRSFAILEREDLDLIVEKAGLTYVRRV